MQGREMVVGGSVEKYLGVRERQGREGQGVKRGGEAEGWELHTRCLLHRLSLLLQNFPHYKLILHVGILLYAKC